MKPSPSLRTTHLLLAVQSVVVILVSINRLSSLTTGYVAPNEFLRWVDLNNMLILPLISTVAFYLLIKHMEIPGPARDGRVHTTLNLLFIVGVYLLATSYGDHEVTNYLHQRFCLPDNGEPGGPASTLCRIVIFNDDEFSHWVFFTGFVLINVGVMLYQVVFPYPAKVGRGDSFLLMLNGLFIGAGIFANLAFEVIGLDLYVVALLAVLSFYLLWRKGTQPLFVYYVTAYGLGLVATFLYKL
ncbi:MAG TPA: hypothetical protein PK530_21030 [Anaerolineales bacterium]|nr:hypothetical protein [Anaerolineales bacterium]